MQEGFGRFVKVGALECGAVRGLIRQQNRRAEVQCEFFKTNAGFNSLR